MRKIKTPSKKIIIISLVLLVAIGATLFVLEKKNIIDLYSTGNNSDTDPPLPENYINLDPPTDEEKKSGDKQKEQIVEEEEKPPASPGKTATVIITDAGLYDGVVEVRSFISNHYEDGTCTITFTQGTKVVKKDTPAYRDASTTICTNPLFKRSEFSTGGQWQVVVSYKAAGATGKSEPKTINL